MANRKTKILAIDDNQDNLITLNALIKEAFPEAVILAALNGKRGLELAASEDPDVILLDIVMPDMDGFDVCKKLKADPNLRDTPVVFVTALKGDKQSRILALEVGADAFLAKPIDESELTAQIRAMVKIKTAHIERRDEKERLAALVEEKTSELKRSYIATINLMEDLKRENEARQKSDEALQASEARYRRITEGLTDYQYTVRIEKGCAVETKHSPACVVITGYTAEEFAADAFLWLRMVAPEDRELIIERARHIMEGEDIPPIEHRIIRKDGELRWVTDNIILYKSDSGDLMYYDGVVKDITERKKAEVEKHKLEEQLRQSHKMEAIGTLAGGVAHDFNNILTAIIGFGTMAKRRLKGEESIGEYIGEMLAAANRAAELTHALLAFSRKQTIALKPENLNDIVYNVEKMLRRVIGEEIEFKTKLAHDDIPVMVDRGQIDQVLLNLATNARDAMPDGGVLSVETDIVDIDGSYPEAHLFENKGPHAVLTVSDTGYGMDQNTRGNIFEPFFTTKEVGKGTGLGLAVVYGIVKQHGGNISVYSEPGKGTTFRIYLPLANASVYDSLRTALPLPLGKGETILVAEDDNKVRKIIMMSLEGHGYKGIESEDGDTAVKRFIENNDSVSLLLLDVIMPSKNGRDAYEEIKRIRPDIKAIFMSGYTDDIIAKKGVLQDSVDFIAKPIDPDALLRKIRTVLDR